MKCESCGITIPEQPEDATPDMLLCDLCEADDTIYAHSPLETMPILWDFISERSREDICNIMRDTVIDLDPRDRLQIAAKLTA